MCAGGGREGADKGGGEQGGVLRVRGGGMDSGEVGWRVGVLMNQLPKALMPLVLLLLH